MAGYPAPPAGAPTARRSACPAVWRAPAYGLGCGKAYFRTQITRTTEALASADVPVALTPFAFRKSLMASAGTRAACGVVPSVEPATSTGFNRERPANLLSASIAAAPEKPSAGAGERSAPLTDALTLLTALPPP